MWRRAAGVSQGTASNVFNRPELVRAEVRERVEATAEQLGYAGPDPKGRLLRAGKVHAIGARRLGAPVGLRPRPVRPLFMAGIADVCDERGAGLALVSAFDDQDEAAAWNVQSALVDGFIVHCLEDGARLLDLARRRNLPFVAVDVDRRRRARARSASTTGAGRGRRPNISSGSAIAGSASSRSS